MIDILNKYVLIFEVMYQIKIYLNNLSIIPISINNNIIYCTNPMDTTYRYVFNIGGTV